MKYILLMFVLTLSATVIFGQEVDSSEIQKIISIRNLTNKAIKDYDIIGETQHYTDNYCITTGRGNNIVGINNYITYIKDYKKGLYIRTPKDIFISTLDTLAFETGIWVMKENNSPKFGGNYTAQWKKQEGVWKTRSEIYVLLWQNK